VTVERDHICGEPSAGLQLDHGVVLHGSDQGVSRTDCVDVRQQAHIKRSIDRIPRSF
jgi:hypothetical protein